MSELTSSMQAGEVGLPSIFFRAADRFRLEGCVAGLVRDGRSLALSSNREAALDHYARLLIARLRESSPLSPLEVYFPADTAAMLTRFNDVLAEQSVQQAMKLPGHDLPARIWIVHDAGALADHEVKLLARLVQNFPGANIRIVLLLGTSVQSRKVFDSFDRRMLRWDIEAPTPEQAVAMLVQGREDGCEGAVKALLKKLEAPLPGAHAVADPAGIDPLGFQSPLAQAPASTDVFTFSGGADKGKPKSSKSPKTSQAKNRDPRDARAKPALWRWVFSVLLLGSISVGVTAWLHPTVFSIDRDELAQRWASLTAKYAASRSSASPAVAPALPPAAAPAPLPAPVPTPAPEPVVPTEPAAAPPAQPVVGVIEPAAEALAAQAWINAMPAASFVLQYAAMPTYQAAASWKKGVPALADARIVAVYRPREKLAYFVVISGPFTTRAVATESGAARGKPSGAWVRTARSLRVQFNSEPGTTGQIQESTR
ncbi:MAG: hypothetical protein Q7U05_15540 [Polaromonas sp.]|nr:hypothetical protein [Polaromonas sp.]